MHEYHTNPGRILQFYVRHEAKIKELNLPDLPLLMTEYGLRTGVGDAGRPNNLQNASGEIAGMILGSYCKNLKMSHGAPSTIRISSLGARCLS